VLQHSLNRFDGAGKIPDINVPEQKNTCLIRYLCNILRALAECLRGAFTHFIIMGQEMKHPISAVITLLLVTLQFSGPVFAYGFPIHNPYEATVVGTPPDEVYDWKFPREVKTEILKLNFDKDLAGVPLAKT